MRDAAYPELKTTHTIARTGRPFTDYKPPPAAPVWEVIEAWLKARKTITPRRLNLPRLIGMQGNPGAA